MNNSGSGDSDGISSGSIERVKIDDPARMLPDMARWIRTQYHTKKWSRLELRHLSPSGGDHVETWNEFEGVTPDQVLRNVYVAASDDARNFKGNQRYGAFFFEEGRTAPMRKLFWVKGAEWDEDDGFGAESEPANAKGLMSALMRYNNDIMRVALTGAREQSHIMQKLLGDQMQQNDKLMGKHFEVLELHERLLDKSHERDVKREDEKSMREVKKTVTTLVATQGVQMLPMLMAKLMGGGNQEAPSGAPSAALQTGLAPTQQIVAPADPATGRAMSLLKHFAGSLNEEQMMKLMGDLTPEQQQSFLELYGVLAEQHRKEAEAAAAAAASQSGDQAGMRSSMQQTEQDLLQAADNKTSG